MNRDPHAWARLGQELKNARTARGLSQAEVAELAGVSTASVQTAEAGTVPKARMPYTLPRIAKALGWPTGSVDAVLDGAPAPDSGWRDVPVRAHLDSDEVAGIWTSAMVRATDNVTTPEIRAAVRSAIGEMRKRGMLPETDGS